MSTLIRNSLIVLPTLLVLTLGCAEVVAPPGGEIDKTGPYLVGSEPPSGAVNVAPGDRITLYFSESIQKPTTGEAMFISPRPAVDPRIKWGRDRVTVILPDSFAPDQTYTVSAGVAVKDLRGNQLDSTLTVAFSTGPVLAEGRTGGMVVDRAGKPVNGLMVALYQPMVFGIDRPLDSTAARYVTQTNAEGSFSIGYLPKETFHLVAFNDRVPNGRFNPGREPFALPDRYITIGGEAPLEELMLTLKEQDTVPPEILSAAYAPDRMLRLRLSKPIDPQPLFKNPRWCLLTSADSALVRAAEAVLESSDEPLAVLNFYPGELPAGDYSLLLTYDEARAPLAFETIKATALKDENPPQLARFFPDDIPRFVNEIEIELTFTEPLDTTLITAETFLFWKQPDVPVGLTPSWRDPLRLLLNPDTLEAGGRYRLDITEFELADRAGNRLGDSLGTRSFHVIDTDSLGSIAGATVVAIEGKGSDPIVLKFEGIGGKRSFDLATMPGDFRVELPAGKYLLSGFVDSNGDGKKGNGSVTPYMLAETMAVFPDTIAVRARFETAGIQVEFR